MKGENKLTEEKSKELALSFLKQYAPDLINIKFQWIDDQFFSLQDEENKTVNIQGKWVKFKDNKTGYYLWVIIAPDGSIIEFDRDIYWNFFRGGRIHELWLRDDWFNKRLKKK